MPQTKPLTNYNTKLEAMHIEFHLRTSLIALLLLCFSRSHGAAEPLGNETDHRALVEFKNKITGDPLKVLSSWNHTLHFCRWHGVTCGRRHGQRVVALDLMSYSLAGSISPHLGNLSFLRVLNLQNNSFSNEIPRGIWDLGRLERLLLVNNSLVGGIPSNVSCSSKLKFVSLIGNRLTGEIPVTLGCLSRLQWLQVSANKLTGKIPSSLGNLSSLEVFSAARNSMGGVLPESLGHLKNLTYISLGENEFSGPIPPSIFNLSNLSVLSLDFNQFQGSLPTEFGTNMPNIEVMFIEINQLSGHIPHGISNATSLRRFEAGDNKFTGSIPSLDKLGSLEVFSIEDNQIGSVGGNDLSFICTLVNATSLEFLVLGNNSLQGGIPTCIGNLSTHLREFGLERNKLSGNIPSEVAHLTSLEWLSFFENQLSGHIPSSIGSLHRMNELYISRNHLSGNIPSSFGNLKIISRLTMERNNLEGSIPPSLGECSSLVMLDISDNKLSGSIPPELFNLATFSMALNLSHNHFTGTIPSQVGNLKSIGGLDMSSNLLSGEIPPPLGSCQSLEFLDISGNLLQGTIPTSLSSLKGLQLLNLSHNKLTGEIPRSLVSLKSLNILDLSHNDLEGAVPSQGIFLNASAISLRGNDKLCGGILKLHLPNCSFHRSNKNLKIILLTISLVLGAAFVVFVVLYRLQVQRKKSKSMPSIPEDRLMELSYHSLHKATDGFSSANLIGTGGFGAVYKGVIDGYKTLVAIKVFDLLQHRALKSFMAECNALRSIRHRNLAKILTACSSIDHQGNDFKALVYEFMSNGSLDGWLHQTVEHDDSNQRPARKLDLLQRINIAIDVASALDYLHHQCETPIVHCDLKPSNVLLDDYMTAHVGDFGLARFLVRAADGSLNHETSSIGIKGTVGYTAPEYGMGGEISTYGDVYSYAVLLLEMFTGKRPTDEIFQDGLNLHQFASGALAEGSLFEIVDPILISEDQEQTDINITDVNRSGKAREFQGILECLTSIIQIGVACSARIPRERMIITDAVTKLSSIRDKLLGTRIHRVKQHHRILQHAQSSSKK